MNTQHSPNPLIPQEVLKKVDVNINSSTSKQMYSFPKKPRFKELKKTSETLFYDLPSQKSHRFAAFGYGGRSDFTSVHLKGKTSVYYDIPSDFATNVRTSHSPQYSFGRGREECKRPINNYDKNDPGPGHYNVRKPLGYDALKFSIFGRGWDKIDNFRLTRNLPGPGNYNEKLAINGIGKFPTSTFYNTHQIGFSKSERFKVHDYKVPGPGTYENDTIFNRTGYHTDSKWVSNIAKTMHERPPQFYQGPKMSTEPGPGSYDFFSDFEGFQREKKDEPWRKKGKSKSFRESESKKSQRSENKRKSKNRNNNNNNIKIEREETYSDDYNKEDIGGNERNNDNNDIGDNKEDNHNNNLPEETYGNQLTTA